MKKCKSFYSKVLLFGEYSVILNSRALSLSYPLFEGRLAFRREGQLGHEPELRALCQYLKSLKRTKMIDFDFDIASFDFDIGQGLYFDSTIPQGFGVGSSGALCAAVYDRYGKNDNHDTIDLNVLKNRLALIESHFHGSSSGMDPLISYLQRPILLREDGQIEVVDLASFDRGETGKGGFFLLNTGRSRKTEPLVNLFLEKCNSAEFKQSCFDQLIPLTHDCIDHFLAGRWQQLYSSFIGLSSFQLQGLNPMIPKLYLDIWKQGLESESFALKLCGAGGGGFLLGMTPDFEDCYDAFRDYEVRPLYRF